jgi:hypothetical protein
MFELDENLDVKDALTLIMDDNRILESDRADLRPLLNSLSDGTRTEFESTVTTFIALYVIQEVAAWRTFLTLANLQTFVCDSVLIMCSEAAFLNEQTWMIQASDGQAYDLVSHFICYMAEQFITIFEP